MADPVCLRCGRPLTGDDIGAHRKLVNRGATEFLCIPCLAAHFRVPEALIREKIEYFRRMGCLLFSPAGEASAETDPEADPGADSGSGEGSTGGKKP